MAMLNAKHVGTRQSSRLLYRPVYKEVFSPPGVTDEPQMCFPRRPSELSRSISPSFSLLRIRTNFSPSVLIILTQHADSFYQISIQLLTLHLSIHQTTNMIAVTFSSHSRYMPRNFTTYRNLVKATLQICN